MTALRSPLVVAATVLAAYAGWALWFGAHRDLVELARVGAAFQGHASGESAAIDALADDAVDGLGYDGQFFLYAALDPTNAAPYIDQPTYRLSRALYPTVARLAALGRDDWLPVTLVLVNLLAVGAGTLGVALLLRRHGVSSWYAAVYGLYPGLFFAVQSDLSEPLAYALVAFALLALERRRIGLAVVLFALAGLTRETTLLFPVALAAWFALDCRRLGRAAALVASVAPYLALRAGLSLWLGELGYAQAQKPELVPFGGLLAYRLWEPLVVEQLYSVVVPALAALVVALVSGASRRELAMLGVNVLVLVVLLPETSYVDWEASGRITTGVMLAFLLCLPAAARARRIRLAWIPLVLWLSTWWTLLPEAFER